MRAAKINNKRGHRNLIVGFCRGGFLFGRIVSCGLANLIMHVIVSMPVMNAGEVLVRKIIVRQHIGKPDG